MQHCVVFYRKDSDFAASRADLTRYGKVWEGEVDDRTSAEDIFGYFQDTGLDLPAGVRHTSMSVGDMVLMDATYYLCMDTGWQAIKY